MIDEQLEGKKGEYSVQVYEVSEGELSIKIVYGMEVQYFYTDFEKREPNPNYNGNYGGE
jgi:hypothetical protein